MDRLLRRQDFLAAARGPSRAKTGCVVQMRARLDEGPARVGFTVTKKLGNAVARNRIRRRLKEAVRTGLAGRFRPGHDYVLIGRAPAFDRAYADLETDFNSALKRLHRPARTPAESRCPTSGAGSSAACCTTHRAWRRCDPDGC